MNQIKWGVLLLFVFLGACTQSHPTSENANSQKLIVKVAVNDARGTMYLSYKGGIIERAFLSFEEVEFPFSIREVEMIRFSFGSVLGQCDVLFHFPTEEKQEWEEIIFVRVQEGKLVLVIGGTTLKPVKENQNSS